MKISKNCFLCIDSALHKLKQLENWLSLIFSISNKVLNDNATHGFLISQRSNLPFDESFKMDIEKTQSVTLVKLTLFYRERFHHNGNLSVIDILFPIPWKKVAGQLCFINNTCNERFMEIQTKRQLINTDVYLYEFLTLTISISYREIKKILSLLENEISFPYQRDTLTPYRIQKD